VRAREQMARLLEVSGCHDVLGAFAWGTLPFAQTLHSRHLFAEEVMPAFSWGYRVADVEGGDKPRQNFRYAGGELTRPCLAYISSTGHQGRTAAGGSCQRGRATVFKSMGLRR